MVIEKSKNVFKELKHLFQLFKRWLNKCKFFIFSTYILDFVITIGDITANNNNNTIAGKLEYVNIISKTAGISNVGYLKTVVSA